MEKGCGRRWLFFSLVLFSTACSSKQAENPAAAPPLPPARDNAVACLGRIEPVDGITRISARSISGQPSIVARLLVDEGDPVKKGQLVAVLDSKEQLEKAWRQAESRIAVAEMRVAQVRAGAKAGDLAAQQAEIGRIEISTVSQNAGPFDRVLQLTHVARPAMSAQRGHTLLAQNRFAAPQLFSQLRCKVPRQQHHIFAAFAQRWNFDRKDCQPKE